MRLWRCWPLGVLPPELTLLGLPRDDDPAGGDGAGSILRSWELDLRVFGRDGEWGDSVWTGGGNLL